MTAVACVDVGATSITAGVVDGGAIGEVLRRRTRPPIEPARLIDGIAELLSKLPQTDRVAVGFPGVVDAGRVVLPGNLGTRTSWRGFALGLELSERLGREVRIANDADVAALGSSRGIGVELTITLGSGVGTGLVVDGVLQHHLELSAIPIGSVASLDDYVGEPARKLIDQATWNKRAIEVITLIADIAGPDQIWLAGGNARRVRRTSLGPLEPRLWVVSDPVGLLGGAFLYD